MNIKTQLLKEHSRINAELIASYVIDHPAAVRELIAIFKNEEYRLVQRAAWPVGIIGERVPEMLHPYLKDFLKLLKHPAHDAVSRNIYRTLQFMEIPETLCGSYFDQCLKDLLDPASAIAIKAFAMTVAFNICKRFAELKPELKMVIEANADNPSAGFQNRARKILKQI